MFFAVSFRFNRGGKFLILYISPKETVKNFDLDLLDNNEEFIDGVLYMSTPIPKTTIDYIQRLEKCAEKLNSNGQKY